MPPQSCIADGDAPTARPRARAADLARMHSTGITQSSSDTATSTTSTSTSKKTPEVAIGEAGFVPKCRPPKWTLAGVVV